MALSLSVGQPLLVGARATHLTGSLNQALSRPRPLSGGVLFDLATGRCQLCQQAGVWRSRGVPAWQDAHRRSQRSRVGEARAKSEMGDAPQSTTETVQSKDQDKVEEKEKAVALDKEVSKVVRKTAATFAPRSSTKTKNPATKGSTLYTIFEVQAWLSIVAGFLLSFNLVLPSDRPDIARLLGMWSVWMLAVPSLRARDCSPQEKEALNYLFLLIPIINVLIPVFWKSFPAVFTADCIAMVGMYAWKMDWFGKDEVQDT